MSKPKCPYCGKETSFDEVVLRNINSYHETLNVVSNCCGRVLRLSEVVSYEVHPIYEYMTEDDFGSEINTNPCSLVPMYLGGRNKPKTPDSVNYSKAISAFSNFARTHCTHRNRCGNECGVKECLNLVEFKQSLTN